MFNYGDRVKIVNSQQNEFNGVTGTIEATHSSYYVRFDEEFRNQVDDYLAFSGFDYILCDANELEKI